MRRPRPPPPLLRNLSLFAACLVALGWLGVGWRSSGGGRSWVGRWSAIENERDGWIREQLKSAHPAWSGVCERELALMFFDENRTRLTRVLGSSNFSQAGQDEFFVREFVYDEESDALKRDGVYLDIGGNHPTELSNTLFLDVCLGWRGIVVEPNSDLYSPASYAAHGRSARVVSTCIDTVSRPRKFLFEENRGILGRLTRSHETGGREVSCITLDDLFRAHSDLLRPGEIDYISFDVEGDEAKIAGCTDLKRLFRGTKATTSTIVWTIETNHLNKGEAKILDMSMNAAGFQKTATIPFGPYLLDDVYVFHPRPTRAADGTRYLPPCPGEDSCSLAARGIQWAWWWWDDDNGNSKQKKNTVVIPGSLAWCDALS